MTIYKTSHALSRETHRAAEGTLVYVSEKGGELYIKARNGWRNIQVCICVWPIKKSVLLCVAFNCILYVCPSFSSGIWSNLDLPPQPCLSLSAELELGVDRPRLRATAR